MVLDTPDRGGGVSLERLVETWDAVDRSLPSWNDLSFGLPRLVTHGLVEVRAAAAALRIGASPHARSLARGSWRDTPWDRLERSQAALAGVIGDGEDRALGRLAGLEEADLEAAI